MCLAFLKKKQKTTVIQSWLTSAKLKKGQYFEKQVKPIQSNNSYDSGKYTVSLVLITLLLKDFSLKKSRIKPVFQFSSVAQSCPTVCNPMNRSTPGLPVHHQLLEFTLTHIHRVSDAIQLSHPLSSPPPPAPNPSQHQSLFQWVNSSHEVAKVLEFQL